MSECECVEVEITESYGRFYMNGGAFYTADSQEKEIIYTYKGKVVDINNFRKESVNE